VVQGSINLQAAGFSAEQAENQLKAFGNALATVGKGKAELDGVILALGQIKSKGKISAEEINQLAERVPQIRQAMIAAFGTGDTEVLQGLKISADEFVDGVTAKLAELPPVTGGLKNSFENLGDSVKQGLGALGDSISKAFDLEGLFNRLSEVLANVVKWFDSLSPVGQRLVVVIGAVLAAIGPLIVAIGFMSSSVIPNFMKGLKAMQAGFALLNGPVGIIIASVAALSIAFAAFTSSVSDAEVAQKSLNDVNNKAKESIVEQKLQMERLISVARDETKSKGERETAIKSLNALSPEYLGNLKLETINSKEATIATQDYVKALFEKARVQAAQERLVEIEKEKLALQKQATERLKGETGVWDQIALSVKSYGDVTKVAGTITNDYIDGLGRLNAEAEALAPIALKVTLDTPVVNNNGVTLPPGSGEKVLKAQQKSNQELLSEEERHTLAMAELNNASENRILNLKKFFAQEKLRLIQETGTADQAELEQLSNTITEIDAQILKLQQSNTGLISTGNLEQPTVPPEMLAASTAMDTINLQLEEVKTIAAQTGETFTQMGEDMGNAFAQSLASGENFADQFGKAIYNMIRSTIKAFLVQAIAGYIANVISTLGPLGLALAAAAPAVVGGLFDAAIPALANGGIAVGPTLAMIGEGRESEAIIPLSKLPSLMNGIGGGQNIQVFGRLDGNDILISSQRTALLRGNTIYG